MIVHLERGADTAQVRRDLQALGLWTTACDSHRDGGVLLTIEPGSRAVATREVLAIGGVANVAAPPTPHPRVDAMGPVVKVGRVEVGLPRPILMAGPCSVESEVQIREAAKMAHAAGATFLRGGAFKPRTSPYSFQGVGAEALTWLREAADAYDLLVVTEAMSESHAELVAEHADLVQIGSRNMQNYALLATVGSLGVLVLLKRGIAATLDEWLLAAEHLLVAGAAGVIFCERGIRHFDHSTRFLLDLGAVALLRDVYRVPVIVDPSHATGRRDLIVRLSLAALAAGAAGVIVESHPNAAVARSDGPQQLSYGELLALGATLGLTRSVATTDDRCLAPVTAMPEPKEVGRHAR